VSHQNSNERSTPTVVTAEVIAPPWRRGWHETRVRAGRDRRDSETGLGARNIGASTMRPVDWSLFGTRSARKRHRTMRAWSVRWGPDAAEDAEGFQVQCATPTRLAGAKSLSGLGLLLPNPGASIFDAEFGALFLGASRHVGEMYWWPIARFIEQGRVLKSRSRDGVCDGHGGPRAGKRAGGADSGIPRRCFCADLERFEPCRATRLQR